MKKLYLLSAFAFLSIFFVKTINAQCTPVDCSATVGPFGGLCEDALPEGLVDEPYNEVLSFYAPSACIDAGQIDPSFAGTYIRIAELKYFEFDFMPDGITASTNNTIYVAPTSGCAEFTGTPTEVGVFEIEVSFLVKIDVFLDATCFFPVTAIDSIEIPAPLEMIIKPDPAFSGLDPEYCEADADVTLVIEGTQGGVFTGPGVSGNTFSPSAAGPGTHTIKYVVSLQQGAAVAPAADSSEFTVTVDPATMYYEDADGDGFGNLNVSVFSCEPVSGFVTNFEDCDDNDASVGNEDFAVWYADQDGDGYHNPEDSVYACSQPAGYILLSESLGEDCDDTNAGINPGAEEIPNNGIDENCSGSDSTFTSINNIILGEIKVFPNPGNSYLTVNFENTTSSAIKVEIFSTDGRKVMSQKAENAQQKSVTFNTTALNTGIYIVTLSNKEVKESLKWIKK
jgi:hypothetical protein